MATQRQIESARINGVKSRGPKTPEGKRRSSTNSRKHGLTSKTIPSDPESDAAFHAVVARYVADLRPASTRELLLIDQMAAAKIRQRQAWAAETEAWNRALAAHDGCLAKAAEALAESGEWACIIRYETRFTRQYHCALELLLAARDLGLRNESDPSAHRDKIFPNEPDRSACHDTILRNEPDSAASNPPSHSDFAKRTGSIAIHTCRRCSHPCFLQNEPAARRRQRVRDEAAASPGQ